MKAILKIQDIFRPLVLIKDSLQTLAKNLKFINTSITNNVPHKEKTKLPCSSAVANLNC